MEENWFPKCNSPSALQPSAVALVLRLGLNEGIEEKIAGVDVNAAGPLPHNTAYYTYEGSLTAPPCSEGVMGSC